MWMKRELFYCLRANLNAQLNIICLFQVDELHKHGSICSLALSSGSLDTALILHNIQRIIQVCSAHETFSKVYYLSYWDACLTQLCVCVLQENAILKKEALETGSRVEEQHCKIGQLAEQRHVIPNPISVTNYHFMLHPSLSDQHLSQQKQCWLNVCV